MSGMRNEKLTVVKLNPQGEETWRYSGEVLRRTDKAVLIEAFFNRDDIQFHGILLGRGDRFIEAYFTKHWYNIFEIHDRTTGELKGWYCNVTRPAIIAYERIEYTDLALDLLVFPDATMLLLDEDEFEELELSSGERQKALAAADELKELFRSNPGKSIEAIFEDLTKNMQDKSESGKESGEQSISE